MMSKDVYSPYKPAFHQQKLRLINEGVIVPPVFVQIDLTNACQLNCSFCWYKMTPNLDYKPAATLETARVLKLLHELKDMGVKAIEWTGGGSSDIHPDFVMIVRTAKGMGFEQALVTNGIAVTGAVAEAVKDFSWVRFSVDAATADTYMRIKGVDAFDKVVHNIEEFMKIRSKDNVVGISCIVCPENHTQIQAIARLAKGLGADNVRFSLAYTPKHETLFVNIWKRIERTMKLAAYFGNDEFKVFTFSNRIHELSQKSHSDFCYYHHLVGVIAANGEVYPCCLLKLNRNYSLGNINDSTFKQIWHGKKRKAFIQSISTGCPHSCWMTEKNKFCTYIAQENAPHVNFI